MVSKAGTPYEISLMLWGARRIAGGDPDMHWKHRLHT